MCSAVKSLRNLDTATQLVEIFVAVSGIVACGARGEDHSFLDSRRGQLRYKKGRDFRSHMIFIRREEPVLNKCTN